MSAHPSIETLRDLVARDQAFFKAQSQRLAEIQQSDPETLSDADKNALSNWDKSVVTDCNRQLLLLEEIAQPTAEECAIMKELNNLITLGDHIMEKRNLVRAELNDRLNAAKKAKAGQSTSVGSGKAAPVTTPLQETPVATDQAATAATTTSPHTIPRKPVPSATTSTRSPPMPRDGTPDDDAEGAETHDSDNTAVINPKLLYDILQAKPDASLNDLKKAAKKATLRLHPDRNLDDPKAAARFADFQAACQVFDSEEKRREFDDTGDVKEIDGLRARLEGLVIEQ